MTVDPGVAWRRRKSDDKEQAKVVVLGLLRQGKSMKEAAEHVGRAIKTLYDWKYTSPKFAAQCEAAEQAWMSSQDRAQMPWRDQRDELVPIKRDDYPSWATYVAAFRQQYFGFDTFDHQWRMLEAMEAAPGGGVTMILMPPSWAKGLAVDTPIPTPDGWTAMGELRVGDTIFAGNGEQTRVTNVSNVRQIGCYRVTFSDGASIVCDEYHLWLTRTRKPQYGESVKPITEIFETQQAHGRPNHGIPVAGPLELPEANLEIDPYLMGIWLGDGATNGARISTADPEIIEAFESAGYRVRHVAAYDYDVAGERPHDRATCLRSQLRRAGVFGNKHIPSAYLRASYAQRLALLQGLIDSDGNVETNGRVRFSNTNEQLIDDAEELVRSLGMKVTRSKGTATLNGVEIGPSWRLSIWPRGLAICRLERKACRLKVYEGKGDTDKWRVITRVEVVASVPTVCISVDHPSELFIAGRDMAVTHNTTMICDATAADLCSDPNFRNALISGDLDFARRTLGRITRRFETDGGPPSPLIEHFGPFKPDGVRSKKWNTDEITLLASDHDEQDPSVISVGIKGRIRGYRWDRVYLDDIQSLNTLGETRKFVELFRQDIITRPGKQGKIIIFGNRVGRGDFYEEMLRLDLVDELVTIPALDLAKPVGKQSNFPRQYRDRDGHSTTDESQGVEPIVDEKGDQMGWSDDDLAQRRAKVGEDQWSRVYMMEPESEYSAMLAPQDIADATDVERRVGFAAKNAVGVICSLDPSLHAHAFIIAAGYDASHLYVYDAIDRFKVTTNQRLFAEIREATKRYGPNFWVIENNTLQSGYLTDDAFIDMREQYGFRAVSHHTGGTKKDAQLGVPAMMEAIRRGEIRFPRITEDHEGFSRLFDQLMSWRPDKPTKQIVQDGVMALWFAYLLWKKQRDAIAAVARPLRRSGLENPTLYPWARPNIVLPTPVGRESGPETYEQHWERLRESA